MHLGTDHAMKKVPVQRLDMSITQAPKTSMVHSSLSSLQHVGRITCDTIHSDGDNCKHAVKDEGDSNKMQDFSVTTYSKCERGERRW